LSSDDTLNLAAKKILIVDDSEANFHLLDVILKKYKAETIWANRGMQAINICKNNKYIDLVLMDINLPDLNGYECTQIIKEDNPKLPIIAQTAYAMAGEKETSMSFGCDDYLAKPIEMKKLIETVLKYL
jgi:CheY-like chemotaxis protein